VRSDEKAKDIDGGRTAMINKKWLEAKAARFTQYRKQKSLRDRPNIVLISLDTLRADHVGCYGYHRDTTPNIDRLAADGIVFKDAFSTSAWTVPAHMSMLTGLWPMDHGLIRYPNPGVLSMDLPLVSEVLWNAGYMTLGFHGGGYTAPHWGFDRGFHVYQSRGPNLEHNLPTAIQWMKKFARRRMFVFLHAFNCHVPYDPPKEYDLFLNGNMSSYDVSSISHLYEKDIPAPESDEDIEKVVAKYDGSIRYADHLVGRFVLELDRIGILEETVFIVTADHGEEFWEHGYFGHTKALYEETLRVPLIVAGRWLDRSRQAATQDVSLVDIVPTVLELAGIERSKTGPGLSLLRIHDDPTVASGRCLYGSTGYQEAYCEAKSVIPGCNIPRTLLTHYIRQNGLKILWKAPYGRRSVETELYDIRQDRLERRNSVGDELSRCKVFVDDLSQKGWVAPASIERGPSEIMVDNEDLKGQLKALGYM
jgi:arylsulfatase A-like enzyme